MEEKKLKQVDRYVKTGIPGFNELITKGIPKGSAVLIAGGTGSGKTIICLQMLVHHASQGKNCYYLGFEESEDRIIGRM